MRTKNQLGTENLKTLMRKLAIPGIVAQLINILYNMVDRMYVGHMAKDASISLTALGVCAPILILISAFCNLVAFGASPLASIELGKGENRQAEKILGTGFAFLIAISILLTAIVLIFKKPLIYLFGGTNNSYPFANSYLEIYVLGTISVLVSLGLNAMIVCQGKAKVAMFTIVIGAVSNIILDPIFIYLLDMGVRGAALATVISQTISAVFVIKFLISDKSQIRLKREYIKFDTVLIKSILALGVSGFVMSATESAIIMVFNIGLIKHGGSLGDTYIGVMTILQSAMMLLFMPISGFTQGVQPIISYNFGASNNERVVDTVKLMAKLTSLWTLAFCAFCYLLPAYFARIFTTDSNLIELIRKILPIFMAGMFLFGLQMTAQSFFVGTNQAKKSLFIALLRKVILLIPLAIILPKYMGVMGVFWAEPISDLISVTVCTILLIASLKKLDNLKAA
ncbi:MAG: MATE family efflux transporter [Tissierellia bacterium]|nr:MATE family efflux transporter [Tissierellia bacterium]